MNLPDSNTSDQNDNNENGNNNNHERDNDSPRNPTRIAEIRRRLQHHFQRQRQSNALPSPDTSTTTIISSLSNHGSITSNENEYNDDESNSD